MSTSISDLCPCIRSKVQELLRWGHEEKGWQMTVVGTGRTPAAQAKYVKAGTSRTSNSKHLPQPGCGLSHAADVAPYHLRQMKNWAPEHPNWLALGEKAEALGLNWGGRWSGKWRKPDQKDYRICDCPHFDVKVIHKPDELTLKA